MKGAGGGRHEEFKTTDFSFALFVKTTFSICGDCETSESLCVNALDSDWNIRESK